MNEFVLQALSEPNGNPSTMRLMAMLCVLVALAMVVISLTPIGHPVDYQIFVTLLATGFGGKWLQKLSEQKTNGNGKVSVIGEAKS
jgi:hypothetical protein